MNDTAPNIAAIVRERLLSRPGAERVVMGSRMFDVARTIALAYLAVLLMIGLLLTDLCYAVADPRIRLQ